MIQTTLLYAKRLMNKQITISCIWMDVEKHIGKYLSRLRKLDDVITPKEGFET
jgi:hypothetical protein